MNGFENDLVSLSVGLLIGRVVIGYLMAVHGAQKLFGWFGGFGLAKTGEHMEHLGFRPGRTFAAAAGLGELVSGLLVALGVLGPIGQAIMISVMIVAIVTVHWSNGLLAMKNGVELPLLYAIAAVVLAVVGFGEYSLDNVLGIAGVWPATLTWIVIGAGIAGGFANVGLRHHDKPLGA